VDELAVRPLSADRCTIEVRAQPGAKRSALVGTWNGRVKVAVRSPAEDGRANEELGRVLALALGLRPKDLELARGAAARLKEFHAALPADVARARLRSHLGIE
jgi:uncharacterized protein (TIGR00251 family)